MSRERGVTVVIPTVAREPQLARALRAIAVAASVVAEPVEVVVADDSRPPARERASIWSLGGLPVRRVFTADGGRKGPAAARNMGVAAARYDVIAFTDDDARCDDQWLIAGLRRLRGEPGLAGVEGRVALDRSAPIDPVRGRLVLNARGGAFMTASLFVRSEAVEAVEGFRSLRADDQRWGVPYREDSDLALRVIDRVGPIPFAPDAIVFHPAEAVGLRRLLRVARYFVVDGAFARLHPGAVPSLHQRPLARLRIRLACATVLILPTLFAHRTRSPGATAILGLGAALSAHTESELRAAGLERPLGVAALDTLRRLPRSLVWAAAAGSARLQGEAMVRLGLVRLPQPCPDRPATRVSDPSPQ